mgnify:CR=1 FL=1
MLTFSGERIVPGAENCEPTFAQKMYQEHIARYAFAAQFAQDAEVLDVGCGVGYGSHCLAHRGAKSVAAMDLSSEAIDFAEKNYFHPAVTYRVGDATKITRVADADLVTCFELIEHVRDQVAVLDGIKRALRPDGILVISTPRPLEELRTDFHEHEMHFQEIYSLLKQRFKHVRAYFEKNYFTSFVGEAKPTAINNFIHVTDQYGVEHADYFVFAACDEKPERIEQMQPVITVNDDSYVLTLENDIVNLRNGENYHLGRIGELTEALSSAERRADVTDAVRSELGGMHAILADLRQELATKPGEIDRLNARIQLLEQQQSLRLAENEGMMRERDDMRRRSQELEEEMARVRQVHGETSRKLAEAETAAYALRSDAGRLEETTNRANDLSNEVNALRYRCETAEATLVRFRKSVSWYITRPIRWFGPTYKKIFGRGAN